MHDGTPAPGYLAYVVKGFLESNPLVLGSPNLWWPKGKPLVNRMRVCCQAPSLKTCTCLLESQVWALPFSPARDLGAPLTQASLAFAPY